MPKNKKFFIVFFLLVFSASAFLFVSGAEAQLKYTLLEKIPGFASTDGSNLPEYVKAIYKVALIVIVLSALFMLTVGGFMYLTSAGNTSAMGTAKGVIFDSLIGLVIALTAWLLLNVINPDLVNVTINGLSAIPMAPAPGAAPITPPGPPIPAGAPWPSDASERSSLGSSFTYNRGPTGCTTVGQAACTSIAGSAAISALQALQAACGCSIMINGGTEYWSHGNKTEGGTHHRRGDYAIDINHGAIDSYITSNGTKICENKGRPVYRIGGAVYWNEDTAHWHANFNNTTCSSL